MRPPTLTLGQSAPSQAWPLSHALALTNAPVDGFLLKCSLLSRILRQRHVTSPLYYQSQAVWKRLEVLEDARPSPRTGGRGSRHSYINSFRLNNLMQFRVSLNFPFFAGCGRRLAPLLRARKKREIQTFFLLRLTK